MKLIPGKTSGVRTRLLPVAAAVGARGFGTIAQLVFTSVAGNLAGPASLGLYFLVSSWGSIFSTIASLGVHGAFLKSASILHERKDNAKLSVLFGKSIRILIVSTISLIVLWAISNEIGVLPEGKDGLVYLVPVAGTFLLFIRLGSEYLKAISRPLAAMFPEYSFPPVIGTIALLFWVVLDISQPRIASVSLAYILGLMAGLIFCAFSLGGTLSPSGIFNKASGHDEDHALKVSLLWPFWGVLLANQLLAFSPYIIMPFFVHEESIAEFGIAHRMVALTATINLAIASIQSPKFAIAWAERDRRKIKKTFHESQLLSMLLYAPFFMIFLLFSNHIGGLFGVEGGNVGYILTILAIGRLINSILGIPDHFMLMTENQSMESRVAWTSQLLLFVFFPFALITGGVLAASMVYAFVFALRAVLSYFFSMKAIGTLG